MWLGSCWESRLPSLAMVASCYNGRSERGWWWGDSGSCNIKIWRKWFLCFRSILVFNLHKDGAGSHLHRSHPADTELDLPTGLWEPAPHCFFLHPAFKYSCSGATPSVASARGLTLHHLFAPVTTNSSQYFYDTAWTIERFIPILSPSLSIAQLWICLELLMYQMSYLYQDATLGARHAMMEQIHCFNGVGQRRTINK